MFVESHVPIPSKTFVNHWEGQTVVVTIYCDNLLQNVNVYVCLCVNVCVCGCVCIFLKMLTLTLGHLSFLKLKYPFKCIIF